MRSTAKHWILAGAVTGVLVLSSGVANAQAPFTLLHSFTSTEGREPGSIIQGTDGNFYGTTAAGVNTAILGTVYKMTPAGVVTTLHSFAGGMTDGYGPNGIIQATDGFLYGTTLFGAGGGGVIFRISTAGDYSILHTFTGVDGYNPQAELIQAGDGNFYGTTSGTINAVTGVNTPGTIFKMTPAGTVTVLHTFDSTDAIHPSRGSHVGALIQATDGNFYGTTASGGGACCGAVFRITPGGVLSALHSFASGATDGASPNGLVQASDGNFYGTTSLGGSVTAPGKGTFYKLTLAGDFTVLHSFTGGATDGDNPTGSLIQATDGNLYGMTKLGGGAALPNGGTVFKATTAGAVTLLHKFAGDGSDGAQPNGLFGRILIQAADRSLYGTTWNGGAGGFGVIFKVRTATGVSSDFDGDGTSDIAVYRPSTGTWFVLKSGANFTTYQGFNWGVSTDVPTPGDYDGDGKVDPAIFRPSAGVWFIALSTTNYATYAAYGFGANTDIPVQADYDGDGKTDVAIYRPSTGQWFILKSSTGFASYVAYTWGVSTDVAGPADYDGDGKADLGIFRPSTGQWFVLKSSSNYTTWDTYQWGGAGDIAVPGDYDGDGKTDIAIYRPSAGLWYVLKSSSGFTAYAAYGWGTSNDVPVPADYDGDGKADVAVYRPSTGVWYVLKSSTNFTTYGAYLWGSASDLPINARP